MNNSRLHKNKKTRQWGGADEQGHCHGKRTEHQIDCGNYQDPIVRGDTEMIAWGFIIVVVLLTCVGIYKCE
jgi:hypothetical protein